MATSRMTRKSALNLSQATHIFAKELDGMWFVKYLTNGHIGVVYNGEGYVMLYRSYDQMKRSVSRLNPGVSIQVETSDKFLFCAIQSI